MTVAFEGVENIMKIALKAAAEVKVINIRHSLIQALDILTKIITGLGLQELDYVDHTHPKFDILRRAKSDLEQKIIDTALEAAAAAGDSLIQMKESLAIIKKGIWLNCPFDEEGQERNAILIAAEAGLKAGIKIEEEQNLQQAWENAKFHYR